LSVENVVLLCSFPDASLYTEFHRLEPAVWEQNSFQDLSLPNWSFGDGVFSLPENGALSRVSGYSNSLSFGTFFLVPALIFEVL
jgi:hypothetical protein